MEKDSLCIDLNIPPPAKSNVLNLDSFGDDIVHKKILDIDQNFQKLLYKLRLKIRLAEIFYLPPHRHLKIHEDGGEYEDVAKLNWVIGGEDSLMHWYQSTKDPVWQKTALGIWYRSYSKTDVKRIHSQKIGFPSLVQVGIPHNVTTQNSNRLCISIMPEDLESGNLVEFERCLNIFKNYMSLSN